jgi:hypothetical protein
MQAKIITVQRSLMISTTFDWDIDWRGKSTGDTNAGGSEVIYGNFPRWIGTPQLGLCQEVIPQWRALRAAARGRVNAYRIPLIDAFSYARKMTAKIYDLQGIKGVGGLNFTTQTATEFQPFMLVKSAVAKGATSVVVDTSPVSDYTPQVGEVLSNKDWPFIVTEVYPTGANEYTLTVEPPFREAILEGEMIDIIPYGIFKVTSDTSGNPSYDVNLRSTPKFEFVEWLR